MRESIINQQEDFQFPQTAEECKTRYDAALKQLQQLEQSEQKDATHRDRHLAARAEAYANQNDVTAEKYLKQIEARRIHGQSVQAMRSSQRQLQLEWFLNHRSSDQSRHAPQRLHRMENIGLSGRNRTGTADKKQIPFRTITRDSLHCSTTVPSNQFRSLHWNCRTHPQWNLLQRRSGRDHQDAAGTHEESEWAGGH